MLKVFLKYETFSIYTNFLTHFRYLPRPILPILEKFSNSADEI